MISPHFELTGQEAKGLLYGLVESDKIQLADHPEWPSMRDLVRQGKVRYREADPGEHWQSYRELIEQVERDGIAYADCEDLSTAVAAEDQVRHGVDTLPYAYTPRSGLFHVVAAVPQGQSAQFGGTAAWPRPLSAPLVTGYDLQDVSAAAGMGVAYGGVRGKTGSLGTSTTYGAEAPMARPGPALGGLFSSFLGGLGISDLDLGGPLAQGIGTMAGKGIRKGVSGWLSKVDLGEVLGDVFGAVSPSCLLGDALSGAHLLDQWAQSRGYTTRVTRPSPLSVAVQVQGSAMHPLTRKALAELGRVARQVEVDVVTVDSSPVTPWVATVTLSMARPLGPSVSTADALLEDEGEDEDVDVRPWAPSFDLVATQYGGSPVRRHRCAQLASALSRAKSQGVSTAPIERERQALQCAPPGAYGGLAEEATGEVLLGEGIDDPDLHLFLAGGSTLGDEVARWIRGVSSLS